MRHVFGFTLPETASICNEQATVEKQAPVSLLWFSHWSCCGIRQLHSCLTAHPAMETCRGLLGAGCALTSYSTSWHNQNWKTCLHDHRQSCRAGRGSPRNKLAHGFQHFYCSLDQLWTTGRLAAFRVQLNLLRARVNWYAGKNAWMLRLIHALSSHLDRYYCCSTYPSCPVSILHPHTRTPSSQSLPCASSCMPGQGWMEEGCMGPRWPHLPQNCNVLTLRNKTCPAVWHLPRMEMTWKNRMAMKELGISCSSARKTTRPGQIFIISIISVHLLI